MGGCLATSPVCGVCEKPAKKLIRTANSELLCQTCNNARHSAFTESCDICEQPKKHLTPIRQSTGEILVCRHCRLLTDIQQANHDTRFFANTQYKKFSPSCFKVVTSLGTGGGMGFACHNLPVIVACKHKLFPQHCPNGCAKGSLSLLQRCTICGSVSGCVCGVATVVVSRCSTCHLVMATSQGTRKTCCGSLMSELPPSCGHVPLWENCHSCGKTNISPRQCATCQRTQELEITVQLLKDSVEIPVQDIHLVPPAIHPDLVVFTLCTTASTAALEILRFPNTNFYPVNQYANWEPGDRVATIAAESESGTAVLDAYITGPHKGTHTSVPEYVFTSAPMVDNHSGYPTASYNGLVGLFTGEAIVVAETVAKAVHHIVALYEGDDDNQAAMQLSCAFSASGPRGRRQENLHLDGFTPRQPQAAP